MVTTKAVLLQSKAIKLRLQFEPVNFKFTKMTTDRKRDIFYNKDINIFMELKFHDTYNIEGNGPMQELTPEQIKEEEHKRRKRAWNRTYWRRRKEREQAAKAAKEKELSEAVG